MRKDALLVNRQPSPERGASLIEWCLVVVLVALVGIPIIKKIPIGAKNKLCVVVVEGLAGKDGYNPGDGTCWVVEGWFPVQVW